MIYNNIKSLGLYFLLFLISISTFPDFLLTINRSIMELLLGTLSICMLCIIGFLLDTQKNVFHDFLSCMLVSIIGVIIWAYCYNLSPANLSFKNSESGAWLLYYLYISNTVYIGKSLIFKGFYEYYIDNNGKLLVIYAIMPSIFIYVGMEIKRLINKLKSM